MAAVNSLWIGERLSDLEVVSINSHLSQGHAYHLWCYGTPARTPAGVVVMDASGILPADDVFCYQVGEGRGSFSAFSNLFRYKLLYEIGGWWVDTDVVALKPFDFDAETVLASERTPDGGQVPATCVIKLPKGSLLARGCFEAACECDRMTVGWGEIGPKLFGRMVAEHGLQETVQAPFVFCPVDWFRADDLFGHCDPDLGGHAVHLWHEMWRRSGRDKNASYPAGCLYERLKSEFLGLRQKWF